MAEPARRAATYRDLLAVPDHLVAEIVGGELHTAPRPASPHALASSALGMGLGGAFQFGSGGPGGWWILDEPELHLGADVLVPDLAGWRRERMPRVPRVSHFELAPDWICEVISPSTGQLDRVKKVPRYAAAGVGHLWLLDPLQRTLEVYRLEGPHYTLIGSHGEDERVRGEPFEAIELDLLLLWGEDRAEE